MIPNTKNRTLASHGVTEQAEFGISIKDSAHLMTILRDTLYSDKVLAVLREYSANAWDSHRDSDKSDVPIKVTLPTEMEPTLQIRDYGVGLSRDDVFRVYTQYGASTKRSSDNSVGMLGIGSKSGFAYSDSFSIVSYHGGMKRTFVAVLDESEKGLINLLHEEPCGNETGVSIEIAVKPEDIEEFKEKAETLFQYFKPRPAINLEIPPLPTTQVSLKNGVIYDSKDVGYGQDKWVAVMGCISYRINLEQLASFGEGKDRLPTYLKNISGALYFDIGEVQINASREELKYSNETKKVLIERFNALTEEFVQQALARISAGNFNPWQRRTQAQILREMGLPLPENCKDLVAGFVTFPKPTVRLLKEGEEEPKPLFTIYKGKDAATSIQVQESTRLILKDDGRAIQGYGLKLYDYIVKKAPSRAVQWDKVQEKLTEMIEEMGIQGIPVVKISSLPWSKPYRGSTDKVFNPKHRVRTFKLKDSFTSHGLKSDNWKVEEREPTDDDVFVIIEKFNPIGVDLYRTYREDQKLGKAFGKEVPPIYAYKSTDKAPVKAEECKGTLYSKWREGFLRSLLTDKTKEEMEKWYWSQALRGSSDYHNHYYYREDETDRKAVLRLSKNLGIGHPITRLVKKSLELRKEFREQDKGVLKVLIDLCPIEKPRAEVELEAILQRYPLLGAVSLRMLWGEHSEKWAHYILLIDEVVRKEEKDVHLTAVHAN